MFPPGGAMLGGEQGDLANTLLPELRLCDSGLAQSLKDVGSRRAAVAAMALEPATVDAVISAPARSKPD